MADLSSSSILVGIDGSDRSARALEWALRLAAVRGNSVTAMSAWNYPAAMLMPIVGTPAMPAEVISDASRATLDTTVDGVLAAMDPAGVAIERSTVMGTGRAVLTEASSEHPLLVIGRTGGGRLERMIAGSTASYCVRHAESPVVVVGESSQLSSQITVAVDGSPSSIEALVWAIELLPDSEVLAVYSHDEWELDELPLDDRFRADLDRAADEMLASAVATAIDRTGAGQDRVRRQVRQGDPRTTLIDQGDPERLLVLGAHGHSGLARWALGSLADYAVNHAPGTVAIWR